MLVRRAKIWIRAHDAGQYFNAVAYARYGVSGSKRSAALVLHVPDFEVLGPEVEQDYSDIASVYVNKST